MHASGRFTLLTLERGDHALLSGAIRERVAGMLTDWVLPRLVTRSSARQEVP
jgi:hypothetical protein